MWHDARQDFSNDTTRSRFTASQQDTLCKTAEHFKRLTMSDDETEAMVETVEDQATEETMNGHSDSPLEEGESIRVGTTASARFNVLSTVRRESFTNRKGHH